MFLIRGFEDASILCSGQYYSCSCSCSHVLHKTFRRRFNFMFGFNSISPTRININIAPNWINIDQNFQFGSMLEILEVTDSLKAKLKNKHIFSALPFSNCLPSAVGRGRNTRKLLKQATKLFDTDYSGPETTAAEAASCQWCIPSLWRSTYSTQSSS